MCAEVVKLGSRRELREVRLSILRSCLCVIMSVCLFVADVCVFGVRSVYDCGVECFLCGLCASLAHDRETVGRDSFIRVPFPHSPRCASLKRGRLLACSYPMLGYSSSQGALVFVLCYLVFRAPEISFSQSKTLGVSEDE